MATSKSSISEAAAAPGLERHLMVHSAFDGHQRGDIIANSAAVQAVYDAGLDHHCTPFLAAPEPIPDPPAAPAPEAQPDAAKEA